MYLGEEYTGDYSDPTDDESDDKDDDDDDVEEDDYVETAKVMNVDDDDDDHNRDYDYDANFGIVMNENDLHRASGIKDYDYSNFDIYNQVNT